MRSKLIAARKIAGLSQYDMAERLGVTRSAISAWEIGRNEPPLAMIIEMKKILKTQDDQIFLPCEDTIGSEDEDGN